MRICNLMLFEYCFGGFHMQTALSSVYPEPYHDLLASEVPYVPETVLDKQNIEIRYVII